MLMMEATEIDDDVLDAVGELTNMVAGAAKAELEEYSMQVSLPNVITGAGHEVHFPSEVSPISIAFDTDWGPISLEVGTRPGPAKKWPPDPGHRVFWSSFFRGIPHILRYGSSLRNRQTDTFAGVTLARSRGELGDSWRTARPLPAVAGGPEGSSAQTVRRSLVVPEFSMANDVHKAAVLLMSLPQEQGAQLMSMLSPAQVEAVSIEIAKTSSVAPEEQAQVIQSFAEANPNALTGARGGSTWLAACWSRLWARVPRAPSTTFASRSRRSPSDSCRRSTARTCSRSSSTSIPRRSR